MQNVCKGRNCGVHWHTAQSVVRRTVLFIPTCTRMNTYITVLLKSTRSNLTILLKSKLTRTINVCNSSTTTSLKRHLSNPALNCRLNWFKNSIVPRPSASQTKHNTNGSLQYKSLCNLGQVLSSFFLAIYAALFNIHACQSLFLFAGWKNDVLSRFIAPYASHIVSVGYSRTMWGPAILALL